MKKFLLILIFFTIFNKSNFVISQSIPTGWYIVSNLFNDSLLSVFFSNNIKGWTVGKEGKIFISQNGGLNWSTQNSNSTSILENVFFLNNDTGFCIGSEGTIIKTTNGGINWIHQNSNSVNYLKSASFVNDSVGFVVGLDKTCLKTTNGGVNWNSVSFIDSLDFYSVKFIDNNTGWISSMQYNSFPFQDSLVIFKSTDGGSNWYKQYIHPLEFSPFLSIQFTDSLNGWMTIYRYDIDASSVYKTMDGGNTWNRYAVGNFGPYRIFFSNNRKGWGVGYFNRISFTTNGGLTWINSPAFQVSLDYNSVFFIDSLIGWAVTGNGLVIKTTTGGILTDFTNISSEIPIDFSLSQNYPNPFNPKTVISYELRITSDAELKVFDVLGNEVAELVNEKQNAGSFSVEFDGSGFASGIYFYSLYVDENLFDSKRMILLK